MKPKNNILQFSRTEKNTTVIKNNKEIPDNKKHLAQESKVQKSMIPEGPLGDLIKYTSQWTNDAVSALFDNVDTQLFEMAEKSENATDQNTYFDAMRIVRLRRSVAHEEFISNVESAFNVETIRSEKKSTEVTSDLESLALIEDDSLEEDLATHNMIAKSERDNKDDLKQLHQRIAYLYQGLEITSENNPIGPTSLCNSFAAAVDTLEAEIKVKLLVFKLFDINIVNKLAEFYQHANQLLIQEGVLPDLKVTYTSAVKRQPQPAGGLGGIPVNTPVQNDAAAGEAPTAPMTGGGLSQFMQQPMGINQSGVVSQPGDAEAYALIQQLIAQNKTGQQQIPQAQFASTSEVMNSLSQIQANPEFVQQYSAQQGHSGSATSALLKEALKQTLQSNQQKEAINQSDDDMIDVIGMLFDFILDDDNLVDSVKSLLSRLQIPIIKIALQDKTFFRNKNHPARKLLNELANAGLGVTDNVTAQNNPLYLKLESLVTRVSNEQTQDIDSNFFDELLDDLHRFLTEFNQGLSSGRGKGKKAPSKDAALQLVTTELSSRIHGKNLPHNIVLLLERVWKDVMFDIFFSDGMESDEWDMAMTFVDTLIWSVDPKIDIQSQKQLVRVIPGILNALNAGLDRIHYPKDLREQLLQDLQNCHLACMKGQDINDSDLSQNGTAYISSNKPQPTAAAAPEQTDESLADSLSAEELASIDAGVDVLLEGDLNNLDALEEDDLLSSLEDGSEEAIADDSDSEEELIEDAYTQQARNLSAGAWVEFKGIEDQIYRAKISWMSEDASAYIFVTQTGQIAEKSLQGLSSALRNKQASILDESPVFERAMDAVLEELQEKTEG